MLGALHASLHSTGYGYHYSGKLQSFGKGGCAGEAAHGAMLYCGNANNQCSAPCAHIARMNKARARRLVKAGLLDKRHARRFALTSAWAELLGYCGNVALNALRISAALEREHALAQELLRRKKARLQAQWWYALGYEKETAHRSQRMLSQA